MTNLIRNKPSTHICIPDPHAVTGTDNRRAEWIGKLIKDVKPDVVVNIGDMFDMPSLSSYDKGKGSFANRRYKLDIDAGLDFDDKLWYATKKAKKKKPRRVFLEGNHEHRLKRMLEYETILEGTVGFKDFRLDDNYTDVVEYKGASPGIISIDGINYAHFFISGVMGRAIGGENHAKSLLLKQHVSSTCGHSHLSDYAMATTGHGKKIMGLVAGVGHNHFEDFAGAANSLWWSGVIIKRAVEDGVYEPQWVSLKTLEKEYG
jgi:hypothetical protein